MSILSLMPLMVTSCGAYFLIRLRFFFLLHPQKCIKMAVENLKGDGAFSSFALALAGTLGIGNIVGVAVGLSVGGPGSVFWLMVSSVFSAAIKYSEGVISLDKGRGKAMSGVIERSFGRFSRPLSIAYGILILILSIVMGAALQSASIGQCAHEAFNVKRHNVAFFITAMLFFAVIKGSEKIKKIINLSIPLSTVIYILLCFCTIFANFDKIDDALASIFNHAFRSESVGGGLIGFLFSEKIKEGYLRAILSNEAGAGTSSIAHSLNPAENLSSVGIMGVLEVLFDTVILCGMTALSLLVSVDDFGEMSGVESVLLGIGGTLGAVGEYLLFVCIFAFAYSTLICWYYYGSFEYKILFSGKGKSVFVILFFLAVFFGATVKGDVLITLSDIILLMLSLISISALMKNSDRIVDLSEKSGIVNITRGCQGKQTLTHQIYNQEDLP